MKAKRIEPAEVKAKRGRPKVARPMKRVNISVNPNDYEAIERLAAANGMSAAMLVRLAMKEFLRGKRGKSVLVALEASR